MTRRSDGKISFGLKEWIAIAGVLVAIAVAWGKMDATISGVGAALQTSDAANQQRFESFEQRMNRSDARTQAGFDEIKSELRERRHSP